MNVLNWIKEHWYFGAGTLAVLLGVVRFIVRRYKKSFEHAVLPFRTYVVGAIKLQVGRHFNQLLARQFGLRKYAQLKLDSFPSHMLIPSVDHARLEIDKAYIRLSLTSADRQTVPDTHLLSATGSMLILGEPGSGKSSLTKKLFRESCRSARLAPARSRLPLHVELRRLDWATVPTGSSDESGAWLLEQMRDSAVKGSGLHDPAFVLDAFRSATGVVVFLDGLDEVPATRMAAATAAIQWLCVSIAQSSEHSSVVVTARTQLQTTLPRDFVDGFTGIYNLDAFTQADVFAFLRRWPYKQSKFHESQRIFGSLRVHPTLAEMCTNPLVLSMYVAQDQRYITDESLNTVRLPDTRPEFYKTIIGELLLYRRAEQVGKKPVSSQTRRSRETLLGRIALDHLLYSDDPANSVSWSDAVRATMEHFDFKSTDEAEVELISLSVDTGIFEVERVGESIRFMHLSLCEFLAAHEATEAGADEMGKLLASAAAFDSAGRVRARRLWETAIFAIALLSRSNRASTLDSLAETGSPAELLLRSIRESQSYGLRLFPIVVHRMREELSQVPTSQWDGTWFSQVRLCISSLADCQRTASQMAPLGELTVDTFLNRLVFDDVERLEKIFELYLEASPSEALALADELGLEGEFRNPSKLVKAMEHPDLVGFAMHRASAEEFEVDPWVLVLAEAALTYELVAQILCEETYPQSLVKALNHVRPGSEWHMDGPLAGTFYGAVMALASLAKRDDFPRLSVFYLTCPRVQFSAANYLDIFPAGRAGRTLMTILGGRSVQRRHYEATLRRILNIDPWAGVHYPEVPDHPFLWVGSNPFLGGPPATVGNLDKTKVMIGRHRWEVSIEQSRTSSSESRPLGRFRVYGNIADAERLIRNVEFYEIAGGARVAVHDNRNISSILLNFSRVIGRR